MSEFVFADDYRLEKGPTRKYYQEFLKGLVHKHNNLMGVIQGFSSLILYDDGISQEVRDSAQQMQDAARSASELNKDVLVPGGCSECAADRVELSQMLTFWKQKAEELGAEKGVRVGFTPREGLPAVTGDSGKLSEVYVNLVRNAVEAAAEKGGGTVAVDLFPPGEASQGTNVDLFIRTTSPDLSVDDIRKAFKPFESTKGSGHFGIGLTSAAVLAADMGMRLGLRHAEGTTTAWLAMRPA